MVRKNYFASCGCNPRNVYFYSCNDCGGDLLLCGKINDKGHMNTPTNEIGATHWAKLPDESILYYKLLDDELSIWIPISKLWIPPGDVPYTLYPFNGDQAETMNTPTEPGYYWLKTGNNPWVIVRIREKGGLVWIDDSWFMFPSNEARWSDRIPEPEGE